MVSSEHSFDKARPSGKVSSASRPGTVGFPSGRRPSSPLGSAGAEAEGRDTPGARPSRALGTPTGPPGDRQARRWPPQGTGQPGAEPLGLLVPPHLSRSPGPKWPVRPPAPRLPSRYSAEARMRPERVPGLPSPLHAQDPKASPPLLPERRQLWRGCGGAEGTADVSDEERQSLEARRAGLQRSLLRGAGQKAELVKQGLQGRRELEGRGAAPPPAGCPVPSGPRRPRC